MGGGESSLEVREIGGLEVVRYTATAAEILWSGRVRKNDGSVTFDWSGTRMSFGVIGGPKEVYIKMNGGGHYFNVHVDGVHTVSFYADNVARDYCIAKDIQAQNATISLVKRSEAMNGVIMSSTPSVAIEVKLPSSAQLGPAILTKSRKIEFVGDSDSAAFGNLAKRSAASLGGMLQMSMKHEDVEKGWIGLVAKAFDADMHGIVISGTGAQWDCDGNTEASMRMYYDRAVYAEKEVMASMEPVDLVVVYLGGNDDAGKLAKENGAQDHVFVEGYAQLLGKIKKYRPDVPVLCFTPSGAAMTALGTAQEQKEVSERLNRLIPLAVQKADPDQSLKICCNMNPAELDLKDDSQWGNLMHWSVKGSLIFAQGAVSVISEVMKWEPVTSWEAVSFSDDKFVKSLPRGMDKVTE